MSGEELRELIRELAETVHATGSIRDHSDPADTTGWNVHGIETCRDLLCVDALTALAAPSTPEPSGLREAIEALPTLRIKGTDTLTLNRASVLEIMRAAPSTPEPSDPNADNPDGWNVMGFEPRTAPAEPSAAQRTNPDAPETIALGKAMDGAMASARDAYGNEPSHYRAHVLVRLREAGWTVERDYVGFRHE